MIRIIALFLFLIFSGFTLVEEDAKIPKVPSDMEFAGMKLKITEAAKKDIQKDVDMLRKSPKYFNIKLDRVKLYFPIIEAVLKEEGVPEDFKYLSVQESALISDAVSTSDAVGFWQFKDFTGREVGLRIDRNIDERMNVVASTHGAAKYFKRHNFFFKNWVYTVLAHMTGQGGAKKYVDPKKFGDDKMTIDANTHWYVKRFLAHKIAFEKELKGSHSEGLKLVEYKKGQGKTISQIADNLDVDEEELTRYNKWLKRGKVPEEKEYSVIVPIKDKMPKVLATSNKHHTIQSPKSTTEIQLGKDLNRNKTIFIKINGIPSILAKNNETVESLSAEGSVSVSKFLKYNDIKQTDAIVEGEIYYLKSKKNKAKVYYHTTEPGETLWDISQKFGIKLKRLAKMNRMSIIDNPETGRLMWLMKTRPKDVPVEIKELPTTEQVKEVLGESLNEAKSTKKVVLPKKEISKVSEVVDDSQENKEEHIDEELKEEIPKSSRKHVVVKGETLYSISKLYNVGVTVLMDMNNTNGAISMGQELLIPEDAQEVPKETDSAQKNQEEKSDETKSEPEKSPRKHIVAKGETLYSISRLYNVELSGLMDVNGVNGAISIGQELLIPEGGEQKKLVMEETPTETESEITLHVVEPGDTMYKVAKKYKISVDKLLELNQKDNFDLSVGEKLIIKE
ncbi:LysM peptidoglycan-binding domain-containing protein [Reichenbachiella sp. MALMAid0571]|uniref:LysM peptidoglycan-binding domain-containing protein n=1 Tax=Reichenbachiella sp. MALMAid0571 TaxID=3143939 RepID=UPI0032E04759